MNTTTTVTAYADWLSTKEWDFFCTFTTRYSMTMKQARRAMERLHSFISDKHGKARIFWVAEPFDARHGYHTHALVHLENPLGKKLKAALRKAWQIVSKGKGGKENNHTVLKDYDKKLGARHYVSKYMLKKDSDYDMLF
jgi:hypothetical protein